MEQIKEEMQDYWTKRAEKFAALRIRELASDKRELWLREFHRYLPAGRKLRILDVGTGSGFFSFLLAAEGHELVGIDLAEEMIHKAKRTAELLELEAEFYVMDAENPTFDKYSFDAVVSRNLTWALPNLGSAYQRWYSLLKPDGILINFDADYCREKKAQKLPENHAHRDVSPELSAAYEHMKEELLPWQQVRPGWDQQLLLQAGFQKIQIDTEVSKRLYSTVDEFFNPTPLFCLCAQA